MASCEDIMLILDMKDNASNVVSSTVANISSSLQNLSTVTDNVMQGLTGKSAMDNILGTSSKAETNKVLLNNMTETQEGAEKLYDTVDKVTDSSLTSMQELIPAMKAFKSATGASDKEMNNITDDMANFGAAVLAQTGSTDLAQQSMMDLSKGVKGAFASLDQYGITEASLQRTGYWNGDEKDVEGFMKAVTKVTGSTEELMETNQGLDALIGKAFSRAGKKMGNEFLPQIKDIKRAFLDIDEDMGGGLSASILAVSGAMEVANTGFSNVSAIVRGVEDIGKVFSEVSSKVKDAKKIEEAIDTVSDVGDVAGKAAGAAAGAEETAVATTSLSASFTSMIVPMLALSATIAIMIPIAAGLAAEALLFLKGIQIVFDALDFGSIDLSDDINGIKQLAEGLAWVGVAMGAMTFANITTNLAVISGGLLNLFGPLTIATDQLLAASEQLQRFASVPIDKSIPKKLQNISKSLEAVSQAMVSLTSTNVTVGFSNFIDWALNLSGLGGGLEQAKNDIVEASKAINKMADDITPLDNDKAKNIQNVCDSLASVSEAFSALKSMRDDVNWDNNIRLFPDGFNIQEALDNVKQDITDASSALAGFTGLTEIPKEVGTKIKSVADTLTSVNEAFQSLRTIHDDINWDSWFSFGSTDMQGALTSIKTQLFYTATNLNGLSSLTEVDSKGIVTKVQSINDTLSNVSEIVPTMNDFPTMEGFDSNTVSTAVTNVKTIAGQLNNLSDITLGEDNTGVLGTINTALESLKTTLGNATGFTDVSVNIGTQIINGVQSGLSPLTSTVTTAVSTATNSSASAGWTGGAYIGTSTTNGFKSALKLADVMTNEMDYMKTAISKGISAAKTVAQQGAEEIVAAFKTGINVGSPGDIARTMKQELIYTEGFIKDAVYPLSKASNTTAHNIVNSFGNPQLTVGNGWDYNSVESLARTSSQVPIGENNKTVILQVNEGAVYVDARNKTEKEARGIMTLALESMDNITDINVDV